MRGKEIKFYHWDELLLFKETNKNNLYLVEDLYDVLGNRTCEFYDFQILVGGEPYFEQSDNLLQNMLSIEKSLLNGTFTNCLLSATNSGDRNIYFHFQFKEDSETVLITDFFKDTLEWKPKTNTFAFELLETENTVVCQLCRMYLKHRPGRSMLKVVNQPLEFLKVTASQKERFSRFKFEIDDMLVWIDKYLEERNLPKTFTQIEFKKLQNADGKFIHNNKSIKIKLDTMTDDKVLFSIFAHEVGHSVQHLFLEKPSMQKYFNELCSRLPKHTKYFKNYLSSPKEMFARSIQTDFIMFVYGEYAHENPRHFLPKHYERDVVENWFISDDELDTFLKHINRPVTV